VPDTARPSNRHHYITVVLQRYGATLDTPGRARPADRHLAGQLYDQGVPLEVVATALTLATCRRSTRPPDAEPLEPIHSLHYFKPVIAELLRRPLDAAYAAYLHRTLGALSTLTPPPDDDSDASDIPW
jgi:hypothetical protein